MSRTVTWRCGWALISACLVIACQKSSITEPADQSTLDRRSLPVLAIPRSVDLGVTHENARAARAEIVALLNLSHLLLVRTEPPIRRLQSITWTWESEGCLWFRAVQGGLQGGCPHLLMGCDTGERIEWSDALDGTCAGNPPRTYANAVVLQGWSAPYGGAGRLFTCEPGKPNKVQEVVAWETLPDGRTIRWQLTDRPAGVPELHLTLDRLDHPEGRDLFAFTLPDSLRWTGEFEPGGSRGQMASYRWRGNPKNWVVWDEFSWNPAGGRWTHYGTEAEPAVRSWGAGIFDRAN